MAMLPFEVLKRMRMKMRAAAKLGAESVRWTENHARGFHQWRSVISEPLTDQRVVEMTRHLDQFLVLRV